MDSRQKEKQGTQSLMINLGEALKHYTVDELNNHLSTVINQKDDKYDLQVYIIDLVCEEYKTNRRNLIESRSNREISEARLICFCLLHHSLGISIRHIAKKIFGFKHFSIVGKAIRQHKTLDPNIKADKKIIDSLQKLQDKVSLKLKKTEKK